jgi:NTP pyrophosphatase (non-canonical NTP hydrolase)
MFPNDVQTLEDFQAFYRWLDEKNNFNTDIFLNMVLLSAEIGEFAQVLKKVYWRTDPQRNEDRPACTLGGALAEHHDELGQELADCLACLLKIANYTGIDLQAAYLKKMAENVSRKWAYPQQNESTKA